MPAKSVDLRVRFRQKYVVAPNGCWVWTGCKDRNGYGGIQVDGEKRRAHRVSHELHIGPVPSDKLVCHSCDNPACVNPDHLWLGDNAANMSDKCRKGRQCQRGTHGRSKLDEDSVRAIRAVKGIRHRDLAAIFEVSPSLIGMVRAEQLWRTRR